MDDGSDRGCPGNRDKMMKGEALILELKVFSRVLVAALPNQIHGVPGIVRIITALHSIFGILWAEKMPLRSCSFLVFSLSFLLGFHFDACPCMFHTFHKKRIGYSVRFREGQGPPAHRGVAWKKLQGGAAEALPYHLLFLC